MTGRIRLSPLRVTYLAARANRRLLLGGVCAVFAWWLTLPSPNGVDATKCQPKGLLASVSARIYGDRFWRENLPDIRRQAEHSEGWDRRMEQMRRAEHELIDRSRDTLNSVYASQPQFAPSDAQLLAQRLRDRADRIEEAESDAILSEFFRKEAEGARQCEAKISQSI